MKQTAVKWKGMFRIMKNQKVIYKITQTFKTNKENPTDEELNEIFNKKLFKVIMRLEKCI